MALGLPYKKEPWEVETIKVKWASRISSLAREGYSVANVAANIFDAADADVTSQMLVGSANFSGTDIFVTLSGGVGGADNLDALYKLRLRITATKEGFDDQKQQAYINILVRNEL